MILTKLQNEKIKKNSLILTDVTFQTLHRGV